MKLFCVMFSLLIASSFARSKESPIYWEENGLIAIEIESAPLVKYWKKETDLKGYSGNSYYTWRGSNSFRAAGKGVLEWRIIITKPGTYKLHIHNRHDFHDSTEQNDVFTQMNDGQWVKTFSSQRGQWNWRSTHEWSHSKKIQAEYKLSAGIHTFRICGRSHGFSIDRFHLVHESIGKSGLSLSKALSANNKPMIPPSIKDRRIVSYWGTGRLGMVWKECETQLNKGESPDAKVAQKAISEFVDKRKAQIDKMKDFAPSFAYAEFRNFVNSLSYTPMEKELKAELMALSRDKEFQKKLQAERIYKDALKKFETKTYRGQPRPISKRTLQSIVLIAKRLKQNYPETPYYDDLEKRLQDHDTVIE